MNGAELERIVNFHYLVVDTEAAGTMEAGVRAMKGWDGGRGSVCGGEKYRFDGIVVLYCTDVRRGHEIQS